MSDDERARRRSPWLVVAPLVALVAGGWFLRAGVVREHEAFKAFCDASFRGEPWPHVQERAATKGYAFVRQSRVGAQPEEWLSELEVSSYRLGCVVSLEQGRVMTTRFSELPARD